MADTFTGFLNLTKPEIGGSRDAWGVKLNANADAVDAWAKTITDTAQAALSRLVANKDANGNVIPWGVLGPVAFAAAVSVDSLSAANSIATPKGVSAGAVTISQAGDTILTIEDTSAAATTFRRKQIFSSKNVDGGDDWLFRMTRPSDGATKDFVFDNLAPGTMWTTGNFTPSEYARKVSADQQQFAGNIIIARTYPTLQFSYGGVGNSGWQLREDARVHLMNFDTGVSKFSISAANGTVSTAEIGDLNSRIEARAANFADDRLNSAKAYTNNYAMPINAKAYNYGGLEIQYDQPGIWLHSPGKQRKLLWLSNDGYMRWRDQVASDDTFRVGPGGDLWMAQFGDLNSRIEARGAAYRDDAVNVARAYTNSYSVAKTGDTMSGGLYIDMNYPFLQLTNRDANGFPYIDFTHVPYGHGDFSWRLKHSPTDNRFNIEYVDNGGRFTVGTGGDVWMAQFGDLNSRIEARAASFADDRLNTAKAYAVAKTGDTMSGDLIIAKAYPTLTFLWGGLLRAAWQLRENSQMYYINMDNGDAYLSIATDGSVYTKQIGDLNRRIEDRGGAFADDRLATATNRINNKSARLAFLADRNVGSQGRGMEEPYSGGVVTGFAQNNGAGYSTDFRYRQLQMSDSNGSWYACGYV